MFALIGKIEANVTCSFRPGEFFWAAKYGHIHVFVYPNRHGTLVCELLASGVNCGRRMINYRTSDLANFEKLDQIAKRVREKCALQRL